MFNSHSDYVSWVKGGEQTSYFDEFDGYVTRYYRVLDTPQLITVTEDGLTSTKLIEGAAAYIEKSRFINEVLTIYSTEIFFVSLFIALAVFLALEIDWNSGIIWSLYVASDVYTHPDTSPVFTDSVLVAWEGIPSDSLSAGLSSL